MYNSRYFFILDNYYNLTYTEKATDYLLSTISVNWTDLWMWPNYPINKVDIFRIVRFLIKFQVHHILYKLSKRCWTKTTKCLGRGCHLLLANKEAFVLTLHRASCQKLQNFTN